MDWFDDIRTWALEYERNCMRPAPTNPVPANALMDMMIWHVPRPLKPFATEVLCALMGDRVRDAF